MGSQQLQAALQALYHGTPAVKDEANKWLEQARARGRTRGHGPPPPRTAAASNRRCRRRLIALARSAAPPLLSRRLQFQQSTEAWQVTNDILHEAGAGMEAHYFAAQTLRTKVRLSGLASSQPGWLEPSDAACAA